MRVGAAAVAIKADDSMIIGGGIHGGTLLRQEGELRASAVVIEGEDTPLVTHLLPHLVYSDERVGFDCSFNAHCSP